MRLLFDLDRKDYEHCTHTYVRNSARSIIIFNGKIAMVHIGIKMRFDDEY